MMINRNDVNLIHFRALARVGYLTRHATDLAEVLLAEILGVCLPGSTAGAGLVECRAARVHHAVGKRLNLLA
jgi:hypothetical protein